MIDPEERRCFDRQVDRVLEHLPEKVRQLLNEVPLYVEDRPSHKLMREMEIRFPEELCGCFTGYPAHIEIFRLGLLEMATNDDGVLDEEELYTQIQTTIMHELGHYYGMDEREVEELGYG